MCSNGARGGIIAKIANEGFTWSGTVCYIAVTTVAAVGVKELTCGVKNKKKMSQDLPVMCLVNRVRERETIVFVLVLRSRSFIRCRRRTVHVIKKLCLETSIDGIRYHPVVYMY